MSKNKNKELIDKLYINHLETVTSNSRKSKGFHLKEEMQKNKPRNISLNVLSNLRFPGKIGNGNIIIQNWETKNNIPSDIGDLIHYPVLIDRAKYKHQSEGIYQNNANKI